MKENKRTKWRFWDGFEVPGFSVFVNLFQDPIPKCDSRLEALAGRLFGFHPFYRIVLAQRGQEAVRHLFVAIAIGSDEPVQVLLESLVDSQKPASKIRDQSAIHGPV